MDLKRIVLCLALVALIAVAARCQQTICIDGKCYPVVSVQTIPSQPVASAIAVPQAPPQLIAPLRSDSVTFRKAFLEAARRERQAGNLTLGQYFVLAAVTRNPAKLEQIKDAAHESAIEEGFASAEAIDWDKMVDLLAKLLPVILKLLELFAGMQAQDSSLVADLAPSDDLLSFVA